MARAERRTPCGRGARVCVAVLLVCARRRRGGARWRRFLGTAALVRARRRSCVARRRGELLKIAALRRARRRSWPTGELVDGDGETSQTRGRGKCGGNGLASPTELAHARFSLTPPPQAEPNGLGFAWVRRRYFPSKRRYLGICGSRLGEKRRFRPKTAIFRVLGDGWRCPKSGGHETWAETHGDFFDKGLSPGLCIK